MGFLQDMKSAVITPCSHFFHSGCLKKWLYVQETCPLCHCQLKTPAQPPALGPEPAQQPNPGAEQNTVHQEATEPPGVEQQEEMNVKESPSPSDSNGQVVEGPDNQEHSRDTKNDSQSLDCDTCPFEASQGETLAEEAIGGREEVLTQDLRLCIQF